MDYYYDKVIHEPANNRALRERRAELSRLREQAKATIARPDQQHHWRTAWTMTRDLAIADPSRRADWLRTRANTLEAGYSLPEGMATWSFD
jgi:hypothetical protein